MINFKKIFIYFFILCIWGLFEWIAYNPGLLYLLAAWIVVAAVLNYLIIFGRSIRLKENSIFLITPILFIVSALVFSVLIDQAAVRQLFIIGVTIGNIILANNIFSFHYHTRQYQPFALENIFAYINLVSLYLFLSSVYFFLLFFGWPNWITIVASCLASIFLAWRTLWSYKLDWAQCRLYIIMIGLIMSEGALVVNFLPTSYLFNAMLLTLVYYYFLSIFRDYLRKSMTRKAVIGYSCMVIIGSILSILTARWF